MVMLLCVGFAQAQDMTLDQLKAKKTEKEDAAKALLDEAADLQGEIDKLPGWTKSLVGTLGGSFAGFNNWISAGDANSSTNAIVLDVFGTARYNGEKHFLYNDLIVGVGRLSTDANTDDAIDAVSSTAPNKLNLSSLYGYKIIENLALSANITYNTALIGTNAAGDKVFNNPGDLDVGVGFTWTPITDFYLMVHPLNYHWKFGNNPDFASAAGAKIKAGYAREIFPGVSWISNLEGFYAYGSAGINEVTMMDRPSASWYEWTNTFAFSVWKGIGVGLTYGIRRADSEILQTQTRYNLGLSYTL